MTQYTSGIWAIGKGEYGIDHGTYWGLYRGSELIDWTRTLKAAKWIAAKAGQKGEWIKGRVTVEVVE